MDSKQIYNHIFDEFNIRKIEYVILHSYEKLPEVINSDIDIAINMDKIESSITLLNNILEETDWQIIQFWRHENFAVDCIISNDIEVIQIDFCTDYERNGRVLIPKEELINERVKYKDIYVPSYCSEFIYILLKKILKKSFSDQSKMKLTFLLDNLNDIEKESLIIKLERFFTKEKIIDIFEKIDNDKYNDIEISRYRKQLLNKTRSIIDDFSYLLFDIKRKIHRILHPTGLFIVLLGVDGSGKTTIANEFKNKNKNSFRQINHYHSRVRILKDISTIGNKKNSCEDATNPHSKKRISGKFTSILKFGYYLIDFLIGNIIITKATIKSSLVLIERYYYDYYVDKLRYNLNISDEFLSMFELFIKKPDVIFVLTGDSKDLLERKHEITIKEIEKQKSIMEKHFKDKAFFIDTTKNSINECTEIMTKKCNSIMRGRRKW